MHEKQLKEFPDGETLWISSTLSLGRDQGAPFLRDYSSGKSPSGPNRSERLWLDNSRPMRLGGGDITGLFVQVPVKGYGQVETLVLHPKDARALQEATEQIGYSLRFEVAKDIKEDIKAVVLMILREVL